MPNFSERVRYADVAAARAAGLFAEGWLPDVLPDAAGPIDHARDAARPGHCARAVFPTRARAAVETALLDYGFDVTVAALPARDGCPFGAPVGETTRRFRNGEGREDTARWATVGEGILWVFDPTADAVSIGAGGR